MLPHHKHILTTPKPKGLEFFRQTDSRAPINRGWDAVFPLRRDMPQYAGVLPSLHGRFTSRRVPPRQKQACYSYNTKGFCLTMGFNPTTHSMLLECGRHQQALAVAFPHWVTRKLYQIVQKEASTIKRVGPNAKALGLFPVSSQKNLFRIPNKFSAHIQFVSRSRAISFPSSRS